MIDFETVKFIELLDTLAAKSAYGFHNIDEIEGHVDGIVYCSRDRFTGDGWKKVGGEEIEGDYVVLDYLIDELHHDVISIYGNFSSDWAARVMTDEDGDKYLVIQMLDDPKNFVLIDDGEWTCPGDQD